MTGGSILLAGILWWGVNLQFCGPVLFGHGESSPIICEQFTNSRCECSLGGHRGFPSTEQKIEYPGGEIDSCVADRARTMTMMMSRIVAALRLIDPATQPHINIQ